MAAHRTEHAAAPLRLDARLQFWLEDRVFGKARALSKFRARELVARSPYQSWEQAAYLVAGKIRDRSARAARLYESLAETRAEQDNELWHVLILEELIAASGIRENQVRFRLMPQLIAFAVFQQFWLLRLLRPAPELPAQRGHRRPRRT